MNSAYNEELSKDDVAELNVGKGVAQRRGAESRDERVQGGVTVDNVGVVMGR